MNGSSDYPLDVTSVNAYSTVLEQLADVFLSGPLASTQGVGETAEERKRELLVASLVASLGRPWIRDLPSEENRWARRGGWLRSWLVTATLRVSKVGGGDIV